MAYTKQIILETLKQCEIATIKEFRQKQPAMYLWYTRHKTEIGELPIKHLKRPNGTLNFELVQQIALKYQHKSDFQAKDKGAYLKAVRERWLDKICTHMVEKPFVAKGGKPGQSSPYRTDLTGMKFGKWTVVGYSSYVKGRGAFWNCVCDCGTKAEVSGGNLKLELTTKCQNCSSQVSKPTKDIYEFLISKGFSATLSDRSFGFELDIVVHSHKFIIEYDGLLWHSSKFRSTEATEKERYARIKNTGYTCFRIFEDEWLNKRDIVLNMILFRLGVKPAIKIDKYEIKYINNPVEYRQFFDANHLDGYGRATFAIGAFVGQKLVSCMTFRPYMQGKYKGQAELARFVSDSQYDCYGLFGKLLKYAAPYLKCDFNATYVVSASDNRISQGKVYANNGFKMQQGSDEPLNYYYYLHSKGLRVHRGVCQKLKPPKITAEQYTQFGTEKLQVESGLMAQYKWGKNEPLYKVWGWGNKLWVKELK